MKINKNGIINSKIQEIKSNFKFSKNTFLFISIKNYISFKFRKNHYHSINQIFNSKINIFIFIFKIIIICINCLNFTYSFNFKLYKNKSFIEIDNKINITFFEKNFNFSDYYTNIKIIAMYVPNFYSYELLVNNEFNYLKLLENRLPRYKDNHQTRTLGNKNYLINYNLANTQVIKKQIELAKSHGIFGFAIFFYWFCGKTIFDRPLNIIYEEDKIQFNYMIIWKNEKVVNENNEILLEEKYNTKFSGQFIEDIKRYLFDKRYIRINQKPVLGIYDSKKIPQLNEVLIIWRSRAKELKIGELYIISNLNMNFKEEIDNIKLFDAIYRFPPNDLLENKIIENTRKNFYYYYGLLYSNIISESIEGNFSIYKGIMLEFDNSTINKKGKVFGDYTPEIFYIINKNIIKWTKENYNKSNRIIFINAWNNYLEGTYLEPDSKYGFGSLNALSKALFNLPYRSMSYKLINLKKLCLVAIQAHIYYEDLINEIVNKTNNIPVKFDLYISTDNSQKMEYIKNFTNRYSKANNLIIKIFENKGRDILPFLIQFRAVVYKYKYFCHIHSKITLQNKEVGRKWRIYLYENLLGSSEVISEILSDFENNYKLGLIYPENYYEVVKDTMDVDILIKKSMNFLLDKLFPGYIIANKYFDFPAGDMFWARSEAVQQIFRIDIENYIPNEKGSNPILWAIERIWLFIVKLNGFFYKTYLKYKAV